MTAFYIDLLADEGPLLSEPYTRQLDGKLRELRFHLDRQSVRITYWITYWIASGAADRAVDGVREAADAGKGRG
jgi:hypothetical protein